MSIWTYPDVASHEFPYAVKGMVVRMGSSEGKRLVNLWNEPACPFCKEGLFEVVAEHDREITASPPPWPDHHDFYSANVEACPACGWWKAQYIKRWTNPGGSCTDVHQGGASLKELDLTNISAPIAEVRDYITARYEGRLSLHPRLFEEVVGSVFSDLGYSAVVTAYSGDDGIDVILTSGSDTIGVQVKRYKNKISVEQIRSLAGALVLNGLTRGIFVTTSTFEAGAHSTADRLSHAGYRIELLDAPRFYDALHLSQRKMYRSWEDFESLQVIAKLPLVRHLMEH